MTVDTNRIAAIEAIRLAKGPHDSFENGAGVMEAVAYISGEPYSDRPECVSPVLGALLRVWNDHFDDETRQRLKPYITRLAGTAGSHPDDLRRRDLLWEWLLGTLVPTWLETAGMHAEAERVRVEGLQALPEVRDKAWANRMAARERVAGLVRDYIGSTSASAPTAPAAAVYEAAAYATAAYAASAAYSACICEPAEADALLADASAFLDAAGAAAASLDADTDAYVAYAADADSAPAAGYTYVEAEMAATVRRLQDSAFDLLDRLIEVHGNAT